MSGVLLCLAAAAFAWPPVRSAHRPAGLRARQRVRVGAGGPWVDRRAGPVLAAVLTAAGGAVLSTAVVAGPRASAGVLAGLPVLGLLMGSGVGADPWRVLTTTGTGTVLLVAGVALEGAGLAWSARLIRRAVRR
jgi:tight adherence protein B